MKFGIKKSGDKYEWALYERSTQKIVQEADEEHEEAYLYFPLSRPQKNFEDIQISLENDVFLAGLEIPGGSYDLLNNIKEFIEKEEPLELNKDYNIDQFNKPLKLNEIEIDLNKFSSNLSDIKNLLQEYKFFRETTLLKGDSRSTINVFLNEYQMYVLFVQPNGHVKK